MHALPTPLALQNVPYRQLFPLPQTRSELQTRQLRAFLLHTILQHTLLVSMKRLFAKKNHGV